jgi:hypothetical protein
MRVSLDAAIRKSAVARASSLNADGEGAAWADTPVACIAIRSTARIVALITTSGSGPFG